jgi:hypothetical protein
LGHRHIPETLTDNEKNHSTYPCQNAAADKQPAQNVDVQVHVGAGPGGLLTLRTHFLPAFAAKSGKLFNLIGTMGTKHVVSLQAV